MSTQLSVEVRPRSTGEILDDAWRLYVADAPLLLAIAGVFVAPGLLGFLWLISHPRPEALWLQILLPALVAALVLLSGLGAPAFICAFRIRAVGESPSITTCLRAAFRRCGAHACCQAAMLILHAPGLFLLAVSIPSLLNEEFSFLWLGMAFMGFCWTRIVSFLTGAAHQIIVGSELGWTRCLFGAFAEAQQEAGKTAIIRVCRSAIFVMAIINLHALVQIVLWTAEHLGGLETAWLGVVLSFANPVHIATLTATFWLLMTPFAEATNYLLNVDRRARTEGLDLWYRVRRLFPLDVKSLAGMMLTLVVGLSWSFGTVHAADGKLRLIREVRSELGRVVVEIKSTDPYADSSRWTARLNSLAERLECSGPEKSHFKWFRGSLKGFGKLGREAAVGVIATLDDRLALVEESLTTAAAGESEIEPRPALSKEELRRLLPPEKDAADPASQTKQKAKQKAEPKRPVRREDSENEKPGRQLKAGPGTVKPMPAGGFNLIGWLVLLGILAAVVVLGIHLVRQHRMIPKKKPDPQSGSAEPTLETIVTRADQFSLSGLWNQADGLARDGRAREAVRTIYLAVLALLHRAHLIRFEKTRTNGEYARQLRNQAPLQEPFISLTSIFEVKLYNESMCQADDYAQCRALAEVIREHAGSEA